MSLVEDGLPYTAIWNGTTYTGVFRYDSAHSVYLFGNTYDDNGEDTGEPFSGNIVLDTFSVETCPHNTQVTEDVNFSLSINAENVHKIDEKYLNTPQPEDDIEILNLLAEYDYPTSVSDSDGDVITDDDGYIILG